MSAAEPVVPPVVRCEDCGKGLDDPTDHVRLDLFRHVPDAPAHVWDATKGRWMPRRKRRARAGGRRFRVYDLCRRCAGEALRQRSARGGTVMEHGRKRALRTKERVPPKRGGRPRLLTDEQLRAAHILYERAGLSMTAIAERLNAASSKGTIGGYTTALLYGWRRLGLPVRERGKAIALARWGTDGTKSKPQKRRCLGTVKHGDRKGRRCNQWAMRGDRFCVDHASPGT